MKYILICFLALNISCSNSRFGDNENNSSASAVKSNLDIQRKVQESQNESEGSADDGIDEPISVAGAFLSCSIEATEDSKVKCQYTDNDTNTFPEIEKVWIESGMPESQLISIDYFIEEASGLLVLALKDIPFQSFIVSVQSVDVGIIKSELIHRLVMPEQTAVEAPVILAGNLVSDGSFESSPVPVAEQGIFFINGAHPYWNVRVADNNNCPDNVALLELQRFNGGAAVPVSSQGSQHVELDSSCTDNTVTDAGNIAIFQEFKTIAGNTYRIEFDVRARGLGDAPEILVVRFNQSELMRSQTTNSQWKTVRFEVVSDSGNSRIEFEEDGVPDGFGSLLDNVVITDLGKI